MLFFPCYQRLACSRHRKGFWHLQLDEPNSLATTFGTLWGRYGWQWMPHGLSPTPEKSYRRIDVALKGYQGRRLSKEIIAKLKPHFARCGLPDRVNADILGPSLTVVNFRTLQNSCTLNTSKRHHHIHSPMWKRTDRNRGYFETVYNRQRCITLRFTRMLSMAARSGKQRVCNNVLQN